MRISKDNELYLSGELIAQRSNWIKIDGELFSLKQVISKYNISKHEVYKICKSDNYKNWEIFYN
jgi:hypothetical protein